TQELVCRLPAQVRHGGEELRRVGVQDAAGFEADRFGTPLEARSNGVGERLDAGGWGDPGVLGTAGLGRRRIVTIVANEGYAIGLNKDEALGILGRLHDVP